MTVSGIGGLTESTLNGTMVIGVRMNTRSRPTGEEQVEIVDAV